MPARVQQESKSAKPRGSVNPKAVRADTPTESTLDTATLQLISDITQTVEASVSAKTSLQPEQDGVATGTSESIALRGKVDAAILKLSKGLLERETEVRYATVRLLLHVCVEAPAPDHADSRTGRAVCTLSQRCPLKANHGVSYMHDSCRSACCFSQP